jgi:hypothetical protein
VTEVKVTEVKVAEVKVTEIRVRDRQNGTTTQQMQNAAKGAWYVWPNGHFGYPKALASHLGRADLKLIAVGCLRYDHFLGSDSEVVIDHAALHLISYPAYEGILQHRANLDRRKYETKRTSDSD